MSLWTVRELAQVLGVDGLFEALPVTGVSIDTRTLKAGDVFVALSGTPSGGFVSSFASSGDGHQWVREAEKKGAVAVIVSDRQSGVTVPQLVVSDTLMNGLWKIAEAARARFAGKVIGLTGSAGKTGTKEYLAAMLPGAHASPASYNNFWGVPLTLATMPKDAPYAVIEMGMNRPGEIARLSHLAKPDVALVVNVKPVHLEALGSLEAIRQEKLSIRRGLTSKGALVVPTDVSLSGLDGLPAQVIRFGEGGDVQAKDWHAHGDDWHVTADADGEEVDFHVQQGAPHRVANALAALACCVALGVPPQEAAAHIGLVGPMPGRGVVQQAGGVTLIDDSFNGNPASMAAALQGLVSRPTQAPSGGRGRRIAILGDMLELGADSEKYHREMADECRHLDGVICVGPLMKNLFEALPATLKIGYVEDPKALQARDIAKQLAPGDTVVVKGSKRIFWVNDFAKKLLTELSR